MPPIYPEQRARVRRRRIGVVRREQADARSVLAQRDRLVAGLAQQDVAAAGAAERLCLDDHAPLVPPRQRAAPGGRAPPSVFVSTITHGSSSLASVPSGRTSLRSTSSVTRVGSSFAPRVAR